MATAPRSNFPVGPAQQPVRPAVFLTPRAQRPGVVSAVGGMGIAVACASLLGCLASAGIAVGLIGVSQSTAQKIKQFAPPALPVSKPEQPVMLSIEMTPLDEGSHGIGAEQRMAAMAVFHQMMELTPLQQEQLDALLRETGATIFPRGVPRDFAALEAALTDHGTTPAASSNDASPVFFITAGGRALINERGAVFYPGDGSPTVRTSAARRLNSTGHPVLRQQDVDALIKLIRDTSGDKMNIAQTQSLSNMLRAPDQTLITINGPPEEPTIGISGASAQSGGYLLIGFAGGSVLLSPAGESILSSDPVPGVSVIACGAVIIMALAEMALGVWLIMISHRLTKQTLLTARLHRRWAMIKIGVVILGAAAFGTMIASHLASRPGSAGNAQMIGMFTGLAIFVLGCAFPVVTMILFSTRRAKLYFDGIM